MNQPARLLAAEVDIIGDMLEDASQQFDDEICNDFPLPFSKENKAIALGSIRHQVAMGWPDEESPEEFIAGVEESEESIDCFNNWLAPYLAHRCEQHAKAPLNQAELQVIAGLLEQLADLRDDDPGMLRMAERCKAAA
jgi:hypothetical protein